MSGIKRDACLVAPAAGRINGCGFSIASALDHRFAGSAALSEMHFLKCRNDFRAKANPLYTKTNFGRFKVLISHVASQARSPKHPPHPRLSRFIRLQKHQMPHYAITQPTRNSKRRSRSAVDPALAGQPPLDAFN